MYVFICLFVCSSIVDSSRGEMSVEELQLFFNTISDCAQQLTFLPAELLQLHQLNTPCLSITSAGKVGTCLDFYKSMIFMN